jgi:K+-transporting ATPase ATPase A chain
VIQTFAPYLAINTLEGAKQLIALGPVASQEAIKMIGTNGGGFFNANSAHPFENPTPFSNLIEMLAIFVIPAALTYTFGYMVKDTRQGWALLATMFVLFFAGVAACYACETTANPLLLAQNIESSTAKLGDLGGNMEGKEVRFGLANSALFTTVTTDASCGAINCQLDSLMPLAGMVPLINMQLGELVFGGVGAGLNGIIVFAVLTVFIAGLMVGRTPEYLGKKIEQKEVKMAILFVLVAASSILIFTAIATVLNIPIGSPINPAGAPANNVNNIGPHGFSEILYAFSSGTANNGSAFAGLNVNTTFYNTLIGLAMFVGRFLMLVPVLALAGSLANKKFVPASTGTFPTHGGLFIALLIAVIVLVGALTFFPALCLGPIVEHLLMQQKVIF